MDAENPPPTEAVRRALEENTIIAFNTGISRDRWMGFVEDIWGKSDICSLTSDADERDSRVTEVRKRRKTRASKIAAERERIARQQRELDEARSSLDQEAKEAAEESEEKATLARDGGKLRQSVSSKAKEVERLKRKKSSYLAFEDIDFVVRTLEDLSVLTRHGFTGVVVRSRHHFGWTTALYMTFEALFLSPPPFFPPLPGFFLLPFFPGSVPHQLGPGSASSPHHRVSRFSAPRFSATVHDGALTFFVHRQRGGLVRAPFDVPFAPLRSSQQVLFIWGSLTATGARMNPHEVGDDDDDATLVYLYAPVFPHEFGQPRRPRTPPRRCPRWPAVSPQRGRSWEPVAAQFAALTLTPTDASGCPSTSSPHTLGADPRSSAAVSPVCMPTRSGAEYHISALMSESWADAHVDPVMMERLNQLFLHMNQMERRAEERFTESERTVQGMANRLVVLERSPAPPPVPVSPPPLEIPLGQTMLLIG
ncbi:hypothetical protein Taro_042788 [Colocasia esculenta]|uniref:Uncharacterized protein n=1 Tax=Colocasia esculenta TaxID=4460 RepID=A0A843WZA3_COLES|nr:hypothetical protein [Colocasia esculenta]